jgi:hypothetical protein
MPADALDNMRNFVDYHMREHRLGVFHRLNAIQEHSDVPALVRHGISQYA